MPIEDILKNRYEKLSELRHLQKIAFPNDFRPNTEIAQVIKQYGNLTREDLEALPQKQLLKLAGRVILHRIMGKASFAQISDSTGIIQIYLRRNNEEFNDGVESSTYDLSKKWDLGDIVGIEGTIYRTQKGELTILVRNTKLLVKNLHPLPDKYHGLTDIEAKYRYRYLDLISNQESINIFKKRSKIIQIIRQFMELNDYLEVETPMMHPIPGGTTARPFITHHNTLNTDLYLRIAPELYLKKLLVGGFNKIFELGRNFRNEGLSNKHNPEFTMMEWYTTYTDYHDLMLFIEKLISFILQNILSNEIINFNSTEIKFSAPFERLTMKDAILKYNSWLSKEDFRNKEILDIKCKNNCPEFKIQPTIGHTLCELFELNVEKNLIQPTFITEFPIEVSPLARRNDIDPTIADRFELIIAGMEIGNGYSELNDAQEQAERLKIQAQAKNINDAEAMHYDEDFINALEYGMPPTAGGGLGIDRLIMLLLDKPNIRDIILFPQLRPN